MGIKGGHNFLKSYEVFNVIHNISSLKGKTFLVDTFIWLVPLLQCDYDEER